MLAGRAEELICLARLSRIAKVPFNWNFAGVDGISTRVHNRVGKQPLCTPYRSAREVRQKLRRRICREDQHAMRLQIRGDSTVRRY